jgi:pimeloyl-ACP methyl ester carboxylesterase
MWWLLLIPVLYVGLIAGFIWFSLHPVRIPIYLSPGGLGTPQETVEFRSEDGALIRGWWVPAKDAKTVAILLHGYMMNRCELAPLAVTLWQKGISSLLIDFRCHGRSSGKKSTLGVRESMDVLAAIKHVRERNPKSRIVLIGSSMGAAASVFALARAPGAVDAIVLDSAYSRLTKAVLGWWRLLGGRKLELALWPTPLIAWPLIGFNPFKVDVADALRKAGDVPTLIFHGTIDDLALPGEAERNYATRNGNSRLVWLSDCGHSEGRWVHPQLYESELFSFLAENGLASDAELVQTSA